MSTNPEPISRSEQIYARALQVIPGGVSRNTVYREPYPVYVDRAHGCYVVDIEGVERVDFANNMASLIHGHAHPAIVEAVSRQLAKGTAYTLATEVEVRFAEHLCTRNPGFEMVRFVNSGTEAVMAAIKAARAYTGRPKIAKAEGAYHGSYDFAEVSQTPSPEVWGELDRPNSVPLAYGTPPCVLQNVVVFPFNDVERTLAILDRHADQIACVLLDPIPHRVGLAPAKPEFVQALYQWTRRNDALLVFDEVLTFRTNYGGAQENYPVRPDLTALGKIIGGGFPVGAIAGRAEVMSVLDPRKKPLRFPLSGTFSANPITMTAGLTAMELFDREAVASLNTLTQQARERVEEAIRITGVPVSLTGAGSMFRVHFRKSPPTTYREAYQPPEEVAILNELLDYLFFTERIMTVNTCTFMFSTAITQKEVDWLAESMLRAFRHIKPKLEKLEETRGAL